MLGLLKWLEGKFLVEKNSFGFYLVYIYRRKKRKEIIEKEREEGV